MQVGIRRNESRNIKNSWFNNIWTFLVTTSAVSIILHIIEYPELSLVVLRGIGIGFELFGISLEIAGWEIEKKEGKNQ